MKVIDLLVDIAKNGVSKEKKHFKYYNRIDEEYDIAMINLSSIIYKLNNETIDINDDIEIIEDTPEENKKIEKLNLDTFMMNDIGTAIYYKVNEIIDRINGDK